MQIDSTVIDTYLLDYMLLVEQHMYLMSYYVLTGHVGMSDQSKIVVGHEHQVVGE